MILLSDPRVAAVPSADDGEEFVDLRELPELRLDGRAADPAGAYARLRAGVVDRLLAAQRALPGGLRLLVVEGYRPYQAQLAIFTGYRDELRRRHPDWSPQRLHRETTKFVSPVEVAPHSTGGAVDLTLCTDDGVELDLGTAIDATPEDSADACFTDAPAIVGTARRHRQIMVDALGGAGMVNYPTEWWHWSYGDRYWALITGAPRTRYGPVDLTAARSIPVPAER
ncbi:M15 family metallopeptidase [Micromonospora vinacea]|uniref:D-alanyl-D-alanine dipeptidase n=1 Tax=Micromonospora vinacea TaxID=709878 RepID=A0ABS0K351_9ACTN|nr:M15 family metallopeptidase [Micromonospora vinacea]MBG6102399.1 D-alanyl-D-alanine dipeptidase [Micromonospora vinacea]WTA68692.1 M15 family metallopeptidase [Micromonospora sp. NBC_00855]